eukprot:CAMPEP_0115365460 /NCGR_PEP_ID=MMETSP0270-20121206/104294_1 /TAXON_ID=71861 /ORGANISM="Scrippsiella trochoidea, Strain CCMP3099" /LENGTH=106 /DNA_ID=CAMNT_0002788187 /DNA_START=461 /DNA_END=781 /DNA_ORIENTATION=-
MRSESLRLSSWTTTNGSSPKSLAWYHGCNMRDTIGRKIPALEDQPTTAVCARALATYNATIVAPRYTFNRNCSCLCWRYAPSLPSMKTSILGSMAAELASTSLSAE